MPIQHHAPGMGPDRWFAALRHLRAVPGAEAARDMFRSDTVVAWQPDETALRGFELRFLLRWWKGLAAEHGGTPPASLRLDPLALRPALAHMMTLETVGGGQDFRFRLFGTNIAQHSGFDLTNRLVSEFPGPEDMVAFLLASYRAAAVERAPLYTEYTPWSGMAVTRWYRLILPLAGPDGTTQRLIVGNLPGAPRVPSNDTIDRALRQLSLGDAMAA